MQWTTKNSITLSQILLVGFELLLFALDVLAYPLISALCTNLKTVFDQQVTWVFSFSQRQTEAGLLTAVYLGSIFAWAALYQLFSLLRQIRAGRVFATKNVTLLRRISWCCFGAAGACVLASVFAVKLFPVTLVLGAAAGLMGLIVRIVKNVFQQALSMQSELELTI